MKLYVDDFDSWEDVISSFTAPDSEKPEPDAVWATYEQEGYEGSAAVVFTRGEKVFVVTGGHCSCYGLEGQWDTTDYADLAEFEACARKETYGIVHSNLDAILAALTT